MMKPHKLLVVLISLLLFSSLYSQNSKKHYKTAEEFVQVGNYKDAIDQYSKAIELQPDYTDAYVGRALASEQVGDLKGAAGDFERALTFADKNEGIYYDCGRILFMLGENEKALEKLNTSINLKKTYVEPYQVKSKVLVALGRYDEALDVCNTALVLKESSENFYNRGVVNVKMGRRESAEGDFLKAISKDKKSTTAYLALADLRNDMNKTTQALEHVNKVLEMDNSNREAYLIRSKIYVKQLDYSKAIDDISKNILLNPDDAEMYYIRGVYYQEFTQHMAAINDFNKVLTMEPERADAYYKRAWSYEQMSNYKAATKDYEALVALSEYDVQAKIMLNEANERLFEIRRETNKPEILISDPAPRDKQLLQFPKNSKVVSLQGEIIDESEIKSLTIDGLSVPVVIKEDKKIFLAAIDVSDKGNILVEATDVYGNVLSSRYTINLTEVNGPVVNMIAPYASDIGEIFLDSNEPSIYVEGKIEDESLIETIIINGVLASYIPNELNPGFSANLNIMNQNKITVRAVDIYGNETAMEYRLNRDAAGMAASNPMGKTWAIFIENSAYQTFASLEGPGKDVTLMRTALAKYQIHNVIQKKDMTKSEMERFFSIELRDLVRSNRVNSILIWYAGHGKFVNESGYWIPVDAKRDDEFSYFNINALKASLQSYSNYVTHTLVITDACESGPSFYQAMRSTPKARSCDDYEATRFKSSQVFSSAGYELAVDNSQFTRTFANSLANNPNACIPIETIVTKVSSAVTGNNQQKPKFGKIAGLEDENGTFFFISKDY